MSVGFCAVVNSQLESARSRRSSSAASSPDTSQVRIAQDTTSPAEKLAVIDAGSLTVDRADLGRIRMLLQQLDGKLAATEEQISDYCVFSVNDLAERGLQYDNLAILEAAWTIVEVTEPNTLKADEVNTLLGTFQNSAVA